MSELKPCPRHDAVRQCDTPFRLYSTEELVKEARGVLAETHIKVWFRHDFIKALVDRLEIINSRAKPDNAPLTLEELRGMDGEPVYIVAYPDWGHWELSEDVEDYFEDRDEDFYGMTMPPSLPDPMGRYGLHMLGWLAYRRKPEPEGGV